MGHGFKSQIFQLDIGPFFPYLIHRNNSSMLLESSCSEVENQKDEVHLPRERFSFSEIWTVQPRSDSCLAEAVGRG